MRYFYFFVFLIALLFWLGPLSFFPLPWPDDAVFYLTGIDWVRLPSHYRMLSQSMTNPNFLEANFNTMPALPLLFGALYHLGVRTLHAARLPGVLAFAAYVCALATLLKHRKIKTPWVILLSLCALFDPIIRWGAMIIRPEIWQGFLFLVILLELDHYFKKRCTTRLSFLLACAAYVHFQAILWVPAVTVAVLSDTSIDLKGRFKKLIEIAAKTLAWLSPWLLYAVMNFSHLQSQLALHFTRLEGHNPFTNSLYGFFQSLYLGMFIPVSYPKLLNPVKALFWIGLLFSLIIFATQFIKKKKLLDPVSNGLLVALLFQFYLWVDKPETWFVSLIHMVYFPWIAIQILQNEKVSTNRALSILVTSVMLLFLTNEGVLAGYQIKRTAAHYNWSQYDRWVNCIDQKLENSKTIWQAAYPDALINLAGKNRERTYYRTIDFKPADIELRKKQALSKLDAIIHSAWMPIDSQLINRNHEGAPEKDDLYFVTEYPWMPDAEFSAPRLGSEWNAQICQAGPFWAMISTRKKFDATQ